MQERINLSPLHWGPKTWFFLESAAIAYPKEPTNDQKKSAKDLLLSLRDLLPCESCRLNYAAYLNENTQGNRLDDIVRNRDTLLNFIVDVHNDVSVKNNKPSRSIEDVFGFYERVYSTPSVNPEYFKNNVKEDFSDITTNMLFHFNPITLLIGVMIGLIIYKFYSDSDFANNRN